jgi:hypothetical protein
MYEQSTAACSKPMLAPESAASSRMRFLQKLSYEKVLVPRLRRPKRQETLIVFDWDDTLMCTNFLREAERCGCFGTIREASKIRSCLQSLETVVKSLLEEALSLGKVMIITNGENGWVECSAADYMPGLVPILQKIDVISARNKYEDMYPGEYSTWKAQAFLDVQRELDPDIVMNMVALGDAEYEINAAKALRGTMAHAVVKTLKLCPCPTLSQLKRQLEFVRRTLHKVVKSAKDRSHEIPDRRYYGDSKGGA